MNIAVGALTYHRDLTKTTNEVLRIFLIRVWVLRAVSHRPKGVAGSFLRDVCGCWVSSSSYVSAIVIFDAERGGGIDRELRCGREDSIWGVVGRGVETQDRLE